MDEQESTRPVFSPRVWIFRCCLCLACLGHAGCGGFWTDMAVTVVVPALPPPWAGAGGWELDWCSADRVGASRLAAPGELVVLHLPRGSWAALRCAPVFGASRGRPYGAVWPADTGLPADGGYSSPSALMLYPDAAGGLEAELAFLLFRGGWKGSGFNLRRFSEEAKARLRDPWDCDLSALAELVAAGAFRSDYFKEPDRSTLFVCGLSGQLVSDSPWGLSLEPDAGGCAVLTADRGLHRWFGNSQELLVSVSAGGSPVWILRELDGRVIKKLLP